MSKVSWRKWGEYNGKEVYLYKISDSNGNFIEVSNFGARLVTINWNGQEESEKSPQILSYSSFQAFIEDPYYMGATIGRFANRISNSQFNLDGKTYHLDANDGVNSNHGGNSGFHQQIFTTRTKGNEVIFSIESPDGEGGFPGKVNCEITYQFSEGSLNIEFEGHSDRKTYLNLTQHAYFNLSPTHQNILSHKLWVRSREYLENDQNEIPTGNRKSTTDFYGEQFPSINSLCSWKYGPKGLNRYFIFDDMERGDGVMCRLKAPDGKTTLEVRTSYPGMVIYTGDYLGKVNNRYNVFRPFQGICLECQYFPDSPNQSKFPKPLLQPGETYTHFINFTFKL